MIIFSENKSFQLHKYQDGVRSRKEEFSNVAFHTLKGYEYFRIKARDTKLLVRSMWPVFRGAPGLQPWGDSYIYPDSIFASFADYNKSYYINDWNRPLFVNDVFPLLPDASYDDEYPLILTLDGVHFIYDTLNMKDVYDLQYADFSLYMDVEAAQ